MARQRGGTPRRRRPLAGDRLLSICNSLGLTSVPLVSGSSNDRARSAGIEPAAASSASNAGASDANIGTVHRRSFSRMGGSLFVSSAERGGRVRMGCETSRTSLGRMPLPGAYQQIRPSLHLSPPLPRIRRFGQSLPLTITRRLSSTLLLSACMQSISAERQRKTAMILYRRRLTMSCSKRT